MHVFGKIRRWFRVVRLILTTNYNNAYLVSFNVTVVGEDMLPYYRKALTRHGFHFHNSVTGCDGAVFEAWLKNGYVVGHKMSDEESSSLYADNDIYETVVSPIIKKER